MSKVSEYAEQLLALVRRLTEADGVTTENESAWLGLLQREFGEEHAPDAEFDAQKLKAVVEGEGDAEELIQLLLMISLSDGQTTTQEWEQIQEVAKIVEVSDERLEALRSETVLAVEP